MITSRAKHLKAGLEAAMGVDGVPILSFSFLTTRWDVYSINKSYTQHKTNCKKVIFFLPEVAIAFGRIRRESEVAESAPCKSQPICPLTKKTKTRNPQEICIRNCNFEISLWVEILSGCCVVVNSGGVLEAKILSELPWVPSPQTIKSLASPH